jgi:hypothetical protein
MVLAHDTLGRIMTTSVLVNYPQERDKLYHEVEGEVMLGGLGLGLDISICLSRPEVTSIEVWEKDEQLIELISPFYPDDRVTFVYGDVYAGPSRNYDCIWMDIVQDDDPEHYPALCILRDLYTPRARKWFTTWGWDRIFSNWRFEHTGAKT